MYPKPLWKCSSIAAPGGQPPLVFSLANTEQEIQKLLLQLIEQNVRLVAMEATGRYHRCLAGVLMCAGVATKVLNPQRARHFAKSIGKLEKSVRLPSALRLRLEESSPKSDRIDAPVLAHYARSIDPTPDTTPDAKQIELADLVSRRKALVQQRVAEANRDSTELVEVSHEQMPRLAARQSKTMLNLIEKQIQDLDDAIAREIESNDDWHNKSQIIDSVPGIGPDSANQLDFGELSRAVAILPELGKLNRQQIAKLAGLAPLARDSGPFKGRRSIGGGRSNLRTILYMLAHNAVMHCDRFKQFFKHLQTQGKAYKVAMTACMRKLLTTLNQMIKTNTHWQQAAALEVA